MQMQNQVREIKYFFYSQAFADGFRTTFAVLLPVLIASYFNQLSAGMTLSLGAFCVSLTDAPGPIIHKRNSMLFCCGFIFLVSLLTSFAKMNVYGMGAEVVVLSFLFSMFIVYGNRASAAGNAALLVMILDMDTLIVPGGILEHSAFIVAGGLWYLLVSLLLYQIQPYRPAQRILGDCIREVAAYLSIKVDFYNSNKNLDDSYKKLLAQQVVVNEKQDAVREVLFKTRQIVNETTDTSRKLVLQFVETVDLFEDITASYYDYALLRERFSHTPILKNISLLLEQIAIELGEIGIAVQSNAEYTINNDFQIKLVQLKTDLDAFAKTELQSSLVLKKILVNIRKLHQRYTELTRYFSKEKKSNKNTVLDHSRFITHQSLDPKIFFDNLTLRSSSFRHALRVAIACGAGFVVVKLVDYGDYSYWILLTIAFILKPAFSLTRQRNRERLIGTIAGGVIGILILAFIPNQNIQFGFMVLFMLITYSFLRINYLVMVLATTPFVIILFNLLGAGFYDVAQERMLDTLIGCTIAYCASNFLFPTWEKEQLKMYMQNMIKANAGYLKKAMEGFAGKEINLLQYKLVRKEVYVSSANLSAAFQRMLSEPKAKRENSKQVHQFVVLNHILFSNIATVITGLKNKEPKQHSEQLQVSAKRSLLLLLRNSNKINNEGDNAIAEITKNATTADVATADDVLLKDQLEFIYKVSVDIDKTMSKINPS
jgi:uncharacterized membrane protein (TIGR01666 family)